MQFRSESDHNRFICALRTLDVMIGARRWTEARLIVTHEIDWVSDPNPPGLREGWQDVLDFINRMDPGE